MSYKYIMMNEVEDTDKTKMWHVLSKPNFHTVLGTIKWHAPWRQYCFEPEPDCIFNRTCLNDIISFINLQMDNRKV